MKYNDFIELQNDEIIKMAKEYHERLNLSKNYEDLKNKILFSLVKTKKFATIQKRNRLENLINKLQTILKKEKISENNEIKINNFCDGIKQSVFFIFDYIQEWQNLDLAEIETTQELKELLEIAKGLLLLMGECRFRR